MGRWVSSIMRTRVQQTNRLAAGNNMEAKEREIITHTETTTVNGRLTREALTHAPSENVYYTCRHGLGHKGNMLICYYTGMIYTLNTSK